MRRKKISLHHIFIKQPFSILSLWNLRVLRVLNLWVLRVYIYNIFLFVESEWSVLQIIVTDHTLRYKLKFHFEKDFTFWRNIERFSAVRCWTRFWILSRLVFVSPSSNVIGRLTGVLFFFTFCKLIITPALQFNLWLILKVSLMKLPNMFWYRR